MTDEEILYAYKLIASTEGLFCEPASAASLAGVIKLFNEKFFRPNMHVVCTLTGSGLKDPDTVFRVAREPIKVDAEVAVVEKALEGIL
jgi:threonine synthase